MHESVFWGYSRVPQGHSPSLGPWLTATSELSFAANQSLAFSRISYYWACSILVLSLPRGYPPTTMLQWSPCYVTPLLSNSPCYETAKVSSWWKATSLMWLLQPDRRGGHIRWGPLYLDNSLSDRKLDQISSMVIKSPSTDRKNYTYFWSLLTLYCMQLALEVGSSDSR